MSMVGLLARFGHDAGRWVSPVGRVSIAPAATGGSGYRVAPHTFHGGDDPVESADGPREDGWWMSAGSMDRERAIMSTALGLL